MPHRYLKIFGGVPNLIFLIVLNCFPPKSKFQHKKVRYILIMFLYTNYIIGTRDKYIKNIIRIIIRTLVYQVKIINVF